MASFVRYAPLLLLALVLAVPVVGPDALRWPIYATLLIWLVGVAHRTGKSERAFLAAVAASIVYLLVSAAAPGAILIEAADRGAQFVAMMVALGLLRDAARNSSIVRDCGIWLIAQKPAWRFLAIAAGGHGFGVALNMGAVLLLGTLIKRSNTLEAAGGDARVVAIREERMNVALIQGFFSMMLWSPMAISVAFSLALVPGVTWFDIGPPALGLTALFFALAWLLDRIKFPPGRSLAPPRTQAPPPVTMALPMAGLILGLVVLVLSVKAYLHFGMIDAITNVAALFGLGWLYAGYHGRTPRPFAAAIQHLRRHAVEVVPEMRPETIVLASASFLGVALAFLTRQWGLSGLLDALHAPGWALSVAIVLFVVAGGQFGIVAMVTTAIAGGAVLGMAAPPLTPVALVMTLQVGWTLSAVLSAYSGGTMLLARIAEVSPAVTRRWNLPWAMLCFGFYTVLAYLFY
ncbi:MAG: hypothetical protein JNJ97_11230 [Alphaproteobacteria bacterium]|nr:hypothetical protein [Alphaproteobacteria bacterium]MCA0449381.1 hypothetical protein [Pseudomonadota bacterium]